MTQLDTQNGLPGGVAVAGEVLDDRDPLAALHENRGLAPQASTTGSEIDVQISTAKRYPRSIAAFIRAAEAMVSVDVETAAGCFYSLKRKEQGGRSKPIEGPSIRMAEIVASCWGNLRCAARVVDVGDRMITAEAVCWDLEKNVAVRQEVLRRITGRDGKRYGDDMVMVTGNAACSIALRNAVIRVVPQVFFKRLLGLAQKVVRGDSQPLSVRRERCIAHLTALGVELPRLLARIRRSGVEEITPDDLIELYGEFTAIRDGETTVEEAFPDSAPKPERGGAAAMNADLKAAPKQPATPAAAAPVAQPAPAEKAPTAAFDEADVQIDAPPFVPNAVQDEGLPSLARARDAIAIWAETSGRQTPSVADMDAALERYAVAIKFGSIKDWIEDPKRVEEFLARARSTTVVWSRYLRGDPA